MATIPVVWGFRGNFGPSNNIRQLLGTSGCFSTSSEAQVQRTVREAGTYSKLCTKIFTNGITASSSVVFRKNGANGNQSITIPASTTGEFEDASNTDAVVAGDLVNTLFVAGGSGTSVRPNSIVSLFAATSQTANHHAQQSYTLSTASTTFFVKIVGAAATNPGTTEANQQLKAKAAGTWRNLNVIVFTNGRGTATDFGTRINGANGSMSVSVPGGATGQFEDTTNDDTIAVDDLICRYATTGTGGGSINAIVAQTFETTDGSTLLAAGFNAQTVNFGSTWYLGVAGVPGNVVTTEAEASHRLQLSAVLSQYVVRVSTNTLNAATSWRLRVNGADGNGSISIPSSTTGWFEDASNNDTVAATDLLCYQLDTTASGSGALTLETWGARLDQVGGGTIESGVGQSRSDSTAVGAGAAIGGGVGQSVARGSAFAVGVAIFAGVGIASSPSVATGAGAATAAAVATGHSQSHAKGSPAAIAVGVGISSSTSDARGSNQNVASGVGVSSSRSAVAAAAVMIAGGAGRSESTSRVAGLGVSIGTGSGMSRAISSAMAGAASRQAGAGFAYSPSRAFGSVQLPATLGPALFTVRARSAHTSVVTRSTNTTVRGRAMNTTVRPREN